MNTDNRGVLRINRDENNSLQVIFKPVNSTVWLRRVELPTLFGVNIRTINACMDTVLKDNAIDIRTACRYDLCVSGSRIKHNIQEVRMDVIIAMAFHLDSPYARAIREWVIRRCLHPGIDILPLSSDCSDFGMN